MSTLLICYPMLNHKPVSIQISGKILLGQVKYELNLEFKMGILEPLISENVAYQPTTFDQWSNHLSVCLNKLILKKKMAILDSFLR